MSLNMLYSKLETSSQTPSKWEFTNAPKMVHVADRNRHPVSIIGTQTDIPAPPDRVSSTLPHFHTLRDEVHEFKDIAKQDV